MQKLDPYINVDPGTMNPFEHGEVFVTDDGGETDLDLGHYERFIDENLSPRLQRHHRLDLLGRCWPPSAGATTWARPSRSSPTSPTRSSAASSALATDDVDVVITEVGGTVGDIEILPFLEAIRQFRLDVGRDNVCYVHVTLVPFIGPSGEQKTKPTQHSVTELRSRGIQPDVIVCRSEAPLAEALKRKISNLCDVRVEAVVNAADAGNLYEIPLVLHEEGLDEVVCELLRLDDAPRRPHRVGGARRPHRGAPTARSGSASSASTSSLPDAYLSVVEACSHGGFHHGAKVEIDWIQAEEVEGLLAAGRLRGPRRHRDPRRLRRAGHRGQDRRRRLRPRARHPLPRAVPRPADDDHRRTPATCSASSGANSSEFDPATPHPVIDLMDAQRDVTDKGGTMRLGAYVAELEPGSRWPRPTASGSCPSATATATSSTPATGAASRAPGCAARATSPDGRLVEFIELAGHPFWVGTQAHPEFKSRPDRPAPLFREFVGAALERAEGRSPHLFDLEARRSRRRRAEPADGAGFRTLGDGGPARGRRSSRSPRRTFVAPDGATFEREVVHHPGAVAVVPVLDDGDDGACWCASTARPLDALMLEIPAGKRDVDGEAPEADRRPGAGGGGRLARRHAGAAGRVPQLARVHRRARHTSSWPPT